MTRRALGRGLDALIESTEPVAVNAREAESNGHTAAGAANGSFAASNIISPPPRSMSRI